MSIDREPATTLIDEIRNAIAPFNQIESSDNPVIQNDDALIQLRTIIIRELNDDDKLKKFVSDIDNHSMSIEQVISFLQSLVSNDKKALHVILSKVLFCDEIRNGTLSISDIDKLIETIPDGQQINFLTKDAAIKLTLQVLNTTLKNIKPEKESIITLSKVMQNIPDTFLDISAKVSICGNLIPNIELKNINIAYNELVKPMPKAKSSGNINLSEFKIATKNSDIDYSTFILLVLGVMQKFAKNDDVLKQHIDEIQQAYISTDYEKAMLVIKSICENTLYADNQIIQAVLDVVKQDEIKEVKLEDNYSRRFFENRLASAYQGNINEFESIDRIARFYIPSHQSISEIHEAMITVIDLAEFKDDKELYYGRDNLKKHSPIWEIRGRNINEGFAARHHERTGTTSDTVLTRNPGVMKSIQPNYQDELTNYPIRNKPTDTNTSDNTDPFNYPSTKPRGAYVASVSGHAYFVVAMLEKYMQHNKNSKTLEVDINNYIKALAISYISTGYHGLMEIIDVINEPYIKAMFNKYKVTVDTNWPKGIIDQAFRDTQTYAKQLAMKRSIHDEVTSSTNMLMFIYSNKIKSFVKNNSRINLECIMELFENKYGSIFQDINGMTQLNNIDKDISDEKYKSNLTKHLTNLLKSPQSSSRLNQLQEVMLTFIDVISVINSEEIVRLYQNNILTNQIYDLIARNPKQANDILIMLNDNSMSIAALSDTQLNMSFYNDIKFTSGLILLHQLGILNDESCIKLAENLDLYHTILDCLKNNDNEKLIKFINDYEYTIPVETFDLLFDQIYQTNNIELIKDLVINDQVKDYLFVNNKLDDLLSFIKQKEATNLINNIIEACQDCFKQGIDQVKKVYFDQKLKEVSEFVSSQLESINLNDINLDNTIVAEFNNLTHLQQIERKIEEFTEKNPEDPYLRLKLFLLLTQTTHGRTNKIYKDKSLLEVTSIMANIPHFSSINELTSLANTLMQSIDKNYNNTNFNQALLKDISSPEMDEEFTSLFDKIDQQSTDQVTMLNELKNTLETDKKTSTDADSYGDEEKDRLNVSAKLLPDKSMFSASSSNDSKSNQPVPPSNNSNNNPSS